MTLNRAAIRMLTIWVHVVPGHLWGGEPLLEGVRAVAVLIHGDQLLLRGSQWREGVHHPFHPIGHHLCEGQECQKTRYRTEPCAFPPRGRSPEPAAPHATPETPGRVQKPRLIASFVVSDDGKHSRTRSTRVAATGRAVPGRGASKNRSSRIVGARC